MTSARWKIAFSSSSDVRTGPSASRRRQPPRTNARRDATANGDSRSSHRDSRSLPWYGPNDAGGTYMALGERLRDCMGSSCGVFLGLALIGCQAPPPSECLDNFICNLELGGIC